MRVFPLAYDSMGVRSMAFAVETSEGLIMVDPGASLAPRRYGLPPHPVEVRELERRLDLIRGRLREASIVIVTHYHYDHYIRGEPDLYRGKLLLVKHPRENINRSQAIRSHRFLRREGVEEIARVEYADGRSFQLGRVRIDVSAPVWHGYPGTRVGRVIMIRIIEEGESIVYTSDAQGPADPEALRVLSSWSEPRPSLLIVDGPPTYFAGFKVPVSHVEAGLRGMVEALESVRPRVMVVDHHLVRDLQYKDKISDLLAGADRLGVRVATAAELAGMPVRLLEARRRELWGRG